MMMPITESTDADLHADSSADTDIDPASESIETPRALEHVGRRRFLQATGAVAGASALSSWLPAGAATAAGVPAGASRFVPLRAPVRIFDQRPDQIGRYRGNYSNVGTRRIRLPIAGRYGVSPRAVAVVATLTAVNRGSRNWVAVFPSGGSIPLVSTLNLITPADVTANLAQVKLGGGAIDIYSYGPCHPIVDVLGYYEPVTAPVSEGRFVPLPTARRVRDTRNERGTPGNDSETVVSLVGHGVPSNASAVVINLTGVQTTSRGYFTAYPDGERRPFASSLNVTEAGTVRAAGVIVRLGPNQRIRVFVKRQSEFVVDVTGYFTGPTSPAGTNGLFVPVNPQRILDTRQPGQIGRLWPNWIVESRVPGASGTSASSIVTNLTGVQSRGRGYLTMAAARQAIPGTSNLNFAAPDWVVPNHVITPVTRSHGVQVYSNSGAHVVIDLMGYYVGAPQSARRAKYTNPAPPPARPAWVIRIPRIGLTSTVIEGHPNHVTDAGYSWHWTGTGYLGQAAHVAVFGHRTEAGGPYRNVHLMQVGDTFTVTTSDRREYTYRMVRRDLTDANNQNILNATRFHPGTTFSLIACTVGYDSSKSGYPDVWAPTSLKYRIIVTAALVSWREF